jgi:hypothetical protein
MQQVLDVWIIVQVMVFVIKQQINVNVIGIG